MFNEQVNSGVIWQWLAEQFHCIELRRSVIRMDPHPLYPVAYPYNELHCTNSSNQHIDNITYYYTCNLFACNHFINHETNTMRGLH